MKITVRFFKPSGQRRLYKDIITFKLQAFYILIDVCNESRTSARAIIKRIEKGEVYKSKYARIERTNKS